MPVAPSLKPLHDRLRRAPGARSVPGALPVRCFGDLDAARVATVGLNPSRREHLDPEGRELDGAGRRCETLAALGAADRASLADAQGERAVAAVRGYFRPGAPASGRFRPLERVLAGVGPGYDGGGAVHLDPAQEATRPARSGLDRAGRAARRAADLPVPRRQLARWPIALAVRNGRAVVDHVRALTDAEPIETGAMARVAWSVAVARRPDRALAVVGRTVPPRRPAGPTRDGRAALGRRLAERARAAAAERG